jgi:hypothetical protein
MVVLEVNTRRALSKEERLADLAESLEFTRRHLAAPAGKAAAGADGFRPGSAAPGAM